MLFTPSKGPMQPNYITPEPFPSSARFLHLSSHGITEDASCKTLARLSAPTEVSSSASSSATATAASSSSLPTLSLKCVGCALCSLLERPLVALNETGSLIRQSKSQALEARKLNTLAEDDGAVDLVESGGELLVGDHLGHNSGDLALGKIEHGGELLDGEGIVVRGVSEEVGAKTLLLDLLLEHGLDLLGLRQEIPDLDGDDEVCCFPPLTLGESLGSLHDVVAGVLWWAGEDLALVVLQHAAVRLADDALLDFR